MPPLIQADLPEPPADAREHSQRLAAVIAERIKGAGGWISFSDYMRAALYEPGLGYYSAGAAKFGEAGDFVTAPEISSLFSFCLAGQCAEVLRATEGDTVLELGAGTGRMAAAMLQELERLGVLPQQYCILETSAELRERQAATLAGLPEHLRSRVDWLQRLPEQPVNGVIVGNEVVDALPVQRFVIERGSVAELGVVSRENGFIGASRQAGADLMNFVTRLELPDDYCSEVNPELTGWVKALSDVLASGMILLLDYGYSRREFYLPARNSGTLRCYYRHRAHEDPFFWPGLQDITAWVDFTALAEAARAAQLSVAGYTTQANFLLAAGLDTRVARVVAGDSQSQLELGRELRTLMLPGEMGDTIKVLGLSRGVDVLPTGFQGRDMRSTL